MNKQEANAKLAELIKTAENAISEAESLADEFGLSFSSPIGAYGMGGWYYGKGTEENQGENWDSSDDDSDGWQSSSASC